VLEGSVREAGSRVRVTAQLIRVSDQMHVWSESFDRGFKDVVELAIGCGPGDRATVSMSGWASAA